jgi:ubiquinone/menaquinone biosynthesis C-methylase UbiE
MKTDWNYTERAQTYDQRADYSFEAIDFLLKTAEIKPNTAIADIGAGTGKLTKLLLDRQLKVHAVEPNEKMRERGILNTKNKDITWSIGTGEQTGLNDNSYELVTFGSSFNVTDRAATLIEVNRIITPGGWFACMWNHRDLSDKIQSRVEQVINDKIPDFDYGARREDQTEVIQKSGLFGDVVFHEASFIANTNVSDYVDAWRSHATLARQAGEQFNNIIREIEGVCGEGIMQIPYVTRMWLAKGLKG